MDAGMLRPYISALVIQYTGTMLDKALDVLRTQIEKSVNRHRGTVAIVATDLEGALINRRSGARDSRPGPAYGRPDRRLCLQPDGCAGVAEARLAVRRY